MRDSQLLFSDGQIIVANATSVNSSNVIDLGIMYDHKGVAVLSHGPENGNDRLIVTCGITPTAGTALYLELQDCATYDGTYKPTGIGIDAANAITIATMVPGYELLNVPLPRGLREFLKIVYTTTGDWTGSVGTFYAGIFNGSTTKNQTPWRV
jgi:hypothetical protein